MSRPLPLSLRFRRRTLLAGGIVAALTSATILLTLVSGDVEVPLSDAVATSLGFGNGEFDFVILTLRLPRALVALGVGVALACSGALFQSLIGNPLVAPDIIGVMSGASLAAVILLVIAGTPAAVPFGALLGALAATALIYSLTWRNGIMGYRFVLVGVGINAVLVALVNFVLVRFPIEEVAAAVLWTTGTLYVRTWDHVEVLAVGLVILLPAAVALLPPLQVLQLGDDLAASLGARTETSRAGVLLVAASLSAVGVAVAGPVGFVALIVPHVARMLLGPLTAGVFVVTGLLGGLLVLLADLVAQHAFSPVSLPVGVVTAAVGAPYFLFLLARTNRGAP